MIVFFFFFSTVSLEPIASCVRLDEFTEVIVSPKIRPFSQPKQEQQAFTTTGKNITTLGNSEGNGGDTKQEHATTSTAFGDDDTQHLSAASSSSADLQEQNSVSNSGLMSRFSGYLRTLFYTHDEENSAIGNTTSESSTQKGSSPNEENWATFPTSTLSNGARNEHIFAKSDFVMCLRVQPEPRINANKSSETNSSALKDYYSLQPTSVFVDFESLPPLVLKSWTCNLTTFPPPDGIIVKTVQISRLLSPKERSVSRTSSTGATSRENPGSKSQDSTNRESESSDRTSQGKLLKLHGRIGAECLVTEALRGQKVICGS